MAATAALLLLAATGAALAQPLYRSVGPDGRVTYSDRAPSDAPTVKPGAATPQRGTAPSSAAQLAAALLPYELREAAGRYPVTLYSANDCAPCASARALLTTRGVPFAERSVASNDDIAAFKNLSGDSTLPFATIGTQPLKGFSEGEWMRYLDAAGYPKTSQLPRGYVQADAAPLVQSTRLAAPTDSGGQRVESPPLRPPAAPGGGSNPAGIRF